MAVVERVSSMVEGLPCVVMVNHKVKNFPVHHEHNGRTYIKLNGKRMHEEDLPFGIEVEI